MTQVTRERIAEVLPPLLPQRDQIELAHTLWRTSIYRGVPSVVVSCQDDFAKVSRAYDEAAVRLRGRWAEGFPGTHRWLSGPVARVIEDRDEQEEADARGAAVAVRADIQRHLSLPPPRKEQTFLLPLQRGHLNVTVTKTAHPAWRVLRPAIKAVTWAAVLGGITAGIYFWPNSEDTHPARAEVTAAPTIRVATTVRTAPTIALAPTTTPLRTYIVQPGDGWAAIAAKLGVTPAALYAANDLTGPTKALYPGDVLKVPPNSAAAGGAAGGSTGGQALAPACYVPGRDTCNCSDFASSSAATAFMRTFDPADVNRLDGDNDGTACDSGSSPSTSGSTGARIGAICRDGTTSSATGSGACSHHGGVAQWITR